MNMKLTAAVFNDIAHCSIHYTTVIVQKIQILAINRTIFSI